VRSTSKAGDIAYPHFRRRPSRWSGPWRFIRTKPTGAVGLLIFLVLCVTALTASSLAPYDPTELHRGKLFTPPSPEFLLGTDNLGRDVLSRVIWGARISLYVGVLSVLFGTSTGGLIGLLSAYIGGRFDLVVQRIMDVMMAFPLLILALALVAALGASLNNVILAISIVTIPSTSRVIRSTVLAIKERQYVEGARAIGATNTRILFHHVMPNSMAPFLIIATAQLGNAILTEASLSFLGLGTPPPTPTWGGMLSGGAQYAAETAPWLVMSPGLAISLVVYGVNMLGDAMRDVWDPRLRRG